MNVEAPKITTAIPLRRYQYGDYSAVVLGEIESPDSRKYLYILALVPEGERQPVAYVTCSKAPRARASAGSHMLAVVSETFTDELGLSDAWADLDAFSAEALKVAGRVLGIGDAEPQQLA